MKRPDIINPDNLRFSTPEYTDVWTDNMKKNEDLEIKYCIRANPFKELIGDLPIKSILEVGCNSGYNLAAIDAYGNYELTGVDFSENAIKSSPYKNINFIVADCHKLPFPDRSFDLVIACGLFDFIIYEDLSEIIDEAKRVANKYFLLIDYASFGGIPLKGSLELLVCRKGSPLFWIRNYIPYFEELEIVKFVPALPEEFSTIPISAWMFRDKEIE